MKASGTTSGISASRCQQDDLVFCSELLELAMIEVVSSVGKQLLGVKDDLRERGGSRKNTDGGKSRAWTFQTGEARRMARKSSMVLGLSWSSASVITTATGHIATENESSSSPNYMMWVKNGHACMRNGLG